MKTHETLKELAILSGDIDLLNGKIAKINDVIEKVKGMKDDGTLNASALVNLNKQIVYNDPVEWRFIEGMFKDMVKDYANMISDKEKAAIELSKKLKA